ncbi:MAG: GDP-L-fucose synthase [Minwuia sp.]|nr:GDP-L-fucose synthase [Minwuia sp.]
MTASFNLQGRRIFVAGHKGMVGQAIVRRLAGEDVEILTVDRAALDLRQRGPVRDWLSDNRPDVVIDAAARVGGIHANNTYPVDFLAENLELQSSLISGAFEAGVAKLLFLGSSCIYPREAPQPISEDALLTGPLEPTNEPYAIAKIAGIRLCQAYRQQYGADFISAMPTNLYGPGDNFHPDNSHVAAALLRRFHEAKRDGVERVTVWGTGRPRREFLHVDDMADACVHLLVHYSDHGHVNVGCGEDISIADFARLIQTTVGHDGELAFDPSKPDGMYRKQLDVAKLTGIGWQPGIGLSEGLQGYYRWFRDNIDAVRER